LFAPASRGGWGIGRLLPWRRGPGYEHPARRTRGRRAAEHDHAGVERRRLVVDAARLAGDRLGDPL